MDLNLGALMKLSPRVLFIGLCATMPTFAAYDLNLSGKVVDAAGVPVAGVEIALKNTEYEATTNAAGAWSLVHKIPVEPPASILRSVNSPTGIDGSKSYDLQGRLLGTLASAGVYVQHNAQGSLHLRQNTLAKLSGEVDTLIVSVQGKEVGRVAQADRIAGAIPEMTLLQIAPTITPAEAKANSSPFPLLLGQTAPVKFTYDASLWRSNLLTVGGNNTTLTVVDQKSFVVPFANIADAQVSLALVSRLQAITFKAIEEKTYGDADFAVDAKASSELDVVITSTTPNVCNMVNGLVHLVGAGTCELLASQAGNGQWNAMSIRQTFTVNPKVLTVQANAGVSLTKIYDGTSDNNTHPVKDTDYQILGVVNNDEVDITITSSAFNSANVLDAQKITTNYSEFLNGAQSKNYSLVAGSFDVDASITPKPLTIMAKPGASLTKVYNATTMNDVSLVKDVRYQLNGVIGTDDVNATITSSAYNSANVADAHVVTVNYTAILTGAQSDNYKINAGSFDIPASISAKPLTVQAKSGVSFSKVYDGTTTNSVMLVRDTHYELSGILGTDEVNAMVGVVGTGSYNSANALEATAVIANYLAALTGTQSGNYTIASPGSFSIPATITKAAAPTISIAFNTATLTTTTPVLSKDLNTDQSAVTLNVSVIPSFAAPTFSAATGSVCVVDPNTGSASFTDSLGNYKAGICDIMATIADNGNFAGATSNVISFRVDGKLVPLRNGIASDGEPSYRTVQIRSGASSQVWMAQNLAYLPSVSAKHDISITKAKYYVYGYDGTSIITAKAQTDYNTYGVLYNYQAALSACPTGWHTPTESEWQTLEMNLGMSSTDVEKNLARGTDQGAQLKANSNLWTVNKGTNTSGFSALPGGLYDDFWSFFAKGNLSYWWTATVFNPGYGWARRLEQYDYVVRISNDMSLGLSLRCLQDTP